MEKTPGTCYVKTITRPKSSSYVKKTGVAHRASRRRRLPWRLSEVKNTPRHLSFANLLPSRTRRAFRRKRLTGRLMR
ncbi:hypothetical protein AVEN_95206-1, partial [Araneus ventricosus]